MLCSEENLTHMTVHSAQGFLSFFSRKHQRDAGGNIMRKPGVSPFHAPSPSNGCYENAWAKTHPAIVYSFSQVF